ncbi:MAG: M23 family metallopeptidase [Bacteroidota bacterium]
MKNYWSLRLSKIALLTICPLLSLAQFSRPEIKFANGETYLYPVNPGLPGSGSLAGTMGELRSTHFHSGIDIRTDNRIGLPILASKSGYISRISVSPSGYGNVLYITHPDDNNTTLYAHLDKFKGAVAEYILQEHYRRKSSDLDLYFRENQFVIKRGDTIALSGNSGSSSGPHLHFDIRDKNNFALNPQKIVHFPELIDNLPPAAEKIALRTLDIHSRINDRFGRFEFYAQRVGSNYVLSVPVLASGNIGVEILAKDRLAPKSAFYGGVNYIEVQLDSQLIFNQSIDKINIAETRGIYTLMDFKTLRTRGSRFYKLYKDDGNDLDFYEHSPSSGKIKVDPSKDSHVTITMKDSYGNSSVVSLTLRPSPVTKNVPLLELVKNEIDYDITENVLSISAVPCLRENNKAILYTRAGKREIEPDYFNANQVVYLIDLRREIPDSVVLCGHRIAPMIKATVPPATEYKYYSDNLDILFPAGSIYDTLYLNTDYRITADSAEIFTIGSRNVPLNKSINVSLLPAPYFVWKPSMRVYRQAGKGYTCLGGVWENGRVNFSTREFGNFTIIDDQIPPTIKVTVINNAAARFKIRDNLSGVADFEATINGQWLLMHYDSKTATIWAERLDKTQPLKGKFELTVTDNAGNKTIFTHKIP